MSQNLGECPICKKEIRPGEDAVVCPDCGTPYHRECYLQNGQCVHKDKHGTGYEYSPPKAHARPGTAAAGYGGGQEQPMISCQNCGTRNPARGIFCESCGAALHGEPQRPQNGPQGFGGQGMPGGFGQFTPPAQSLAGEIDGIPKQDWNTYIGQNAGAYLPRMEQQERSGHKISFMISAFFIPELYFAYRKMWGWGALAVAAMGLTLVPDVLNAMLMQGMSLGIPMATLDTLGNVVFVLALAIRAFSGLFSAYIYRRSAGKTIRKLREKHTSPAEYENALSRRGGTSALAVIAVFTLYLAAILLLQYAFGIDMFSYVASMYMLY